MLCRSVEFESAIFDFWRSRNGFSASFAGTSPSTGHFVSCKGVPWCVHLTNLTGHLCSYGVADLCVQTLNLRAPGVSVVLLYELSFPPVFDEHILLKVNWKPWEYRGFGAEQFPGGMERMFSSFLGYEQYADGCPPQVSGWRSKICKVLHFDPQSARDQAMISIWAFNLSGSCLTLEILEQIMQLSCAMVVWKWC